MVTGFGIPNPPTVGASARISLSSSLNTWPFEMAGIKVYLAHSPTGLIRPIPVIVPV